jgi:uncharacterized membrane protein affecting hemolysin expression
MFTEKRKKNHFPATLIINTLFFYTFQGTVKCMKAGSMLRIGRGRLQALAADNLGHVLACHSTNNMVELFYFNSDEETQNKFSKRLKKWKKKGPEK